MVYYLLAMSEFFTVDETHFSLVSLKVNEEVKFGERFSALGPTPNAYNR